MVRQCVSEKLSPCSCSFKYRFKFFKTDFWKKGMFISCPLNFLAAFQAVRCGDGGWGVVSVFVLYQITVEEKL